MTVAEYGTYPVITDPFDSDEADLVVAGISDRSPVFDPQNINLSFILGAWRIFSEEGSSEKGLLSVRPSHTEFSVD